MNIIRKITRTLHGFGPRVLSIKHDSWMRKSDPSWQNLYSTEKSGRDGA